MLWSGSAMKQKTKATVLNALEKKVERDLRVWPRNSVILIASARRELRVQRTEAQKIHPTHTHDIPE